MRKRLLTLLPALTVAVLAGGVAWAQTTNLASLRVGTAGEGGVTFFNGSIVNESGPVVVADDLRVDGVITRLNGTADKPVRVDDGLNVTGDVTLDQDLAVTGDVTADNLYTKTEADARYVSQSSPSWDAQTRVISIHPSAFASNDETSDFTLNDNALFLDTVNVETFRAPVMLPDGATITGVRAIGRDNNALGTLQVNLERQDPTTATTSQIASVNTTSDSTDIVTLTEDTLTNTTVDNDTYNYHAEAVLTVLGGTANQVSFRGIEIEYTTTSF